MSWNWTCSGASKEPAEKEVLDTCGPGSGNTPPRFVNPPKDRGKRGLIETILQNGNTKGVEIEK